MLVFMTLPVKANMTAELIDNEVKKLIENAYIKTKELLMQNKDKLTKLADKLLEKEVIFKEDLLAIFGKRPFDSEEKADEPKPSVNGYVENHNGENPVIPVIPVIEEKNAESAATESAASEKPKETPATSEIEPENSEKKKDDNNLKLF